MNFVVADHSLSLQEVINMPFALGTYERRWKTSEETIQQMMGSKVIAANTEHRRIIKELVTACGIQEQVRVVTNMQDDTAIRMYRPRHYHSHNYNDLLVPTMLVEIGEFSYENRDGSLNYIDPMTISFWEHPAINRIPTWVTIGRYYGYPECCIKAFLDRARASHTDMGIYDQIGKRSEGYPCIVCESHSEMPVDEFTALVMRNRCSPYPLEDNACDTVDKQFVDDLTYLLKLQTGALTEPYNLQDPQTPQELWNPPL